MLAGTVPASLLNLYHLAELRMGNNQWSGEDLLPSGSLGACRSARRQLACWSWLAAGSSIFVSCT